MTSINTNVAALTALRTLQQTSTDLSATENRIATGLKIGSAKDNAAYWSITTALKSDNKSLTTVKDALGLGAGTVDVAYQGLTKAKDVLDEIKAKLTSATQAGVDRTAVQADLSALQDQLKSIATSSNFSGENWLQVNSALSGYDPNKTVVSSFSRAPDNSVTIGTIKIDTSNTALFDTNAAGGGIVDGAASLTANGVDLTVGGTAAAGSAPATQGLAATVATAGTAVAAATAAVASLGTLDRTNLHVNDRISFTAAVNGASGPAAQQVTVQVDATALSSDANFIAAIQTGLNAKFSGTSAVTASNVGGVITLATTTATGTGASIVVSGVTALDGDGAAITQSTATGGLLGTTPLATGTSTQATSTVTFGAAAAAAAAGQERLVEFNFQYGNETYSASLNEAAIAGITTAATLATALDTALHAATRVGDGVVFSVAHTNVASGALAAGFTVGIDPTTPAGTAVVIRSNGSGADEKIGFSNINSYAITTATGLRSTATAGTALFTGGTFAAGTDTAAVLTSTFALGTIAAGDRITFDATLSTGPLTANQTTASVSIQTNAAWTAATFATSVQQAVDTAFGAGKILVTNAAGTTTFTTVATGAAVALSISNVLAKDGDGATASNGGLTAGSATGTAATVASAATVLGGSAFAGPVTFDTSAKLTFNVAVDGGTATALTINKATVDAALGGTAGTITTAADFATVVQQALTNANVSGLTASVDGASKLLLTYGTLGAHSVAITGAVGSAGASTISVSDIDLTSTTFTSLTDAQKADVLSAYISVVNSAITKVTSAAASLGSVSSRIDLQTSFVTTLIDTIDKGVGNLIDADVSEESTKLQALQVKQQLGVQALSIANSSSQNILQLFK